MAPWPMASCEVATLHGSMGAGLLGGPRAAHAGTFCQIFCWDLLSPSTLTTERPLTLRLLAFLRQPLPLRTGAMPAAAAAAAAGPAPLLPPPSLSMPLAAAASAAAARRLVGLDAIACSVFPRSVPRRRGGSAPPCSRTASGGCGARGAPSNLLAKRILHDLYWRQAEGWPDGRANAAPPAPARCRAPARATRSSPASSTRTPEDTKSARGGPCVHKGAGSRPGGAAPAR